MLRKNINKMASYNDYIRKLKWFTYVNTKRNWNDTIGRIRTKYGKNPTIVLGDWSSKGRVNYMSTPNMGLRRKLEEHFKVYLIDEHNTSKINCKTHQKNENLVLPIEVTNKVTKVKRIVNKEIYSIFTYKMIDNREYVGPVHETFDTVIGCINRDKNATRNMRYITEEIIKKGGRPETFQRKPENPPVMALGKVGKKAVKSVLLK
jgi:hypothetical protein